MKTPEEMAEEYAKEHHMGGWEYEASIPAWLAGYQAAKDQVADVGKVMPQWNSVDTVGDSINQSAIQHTLATLEKKPAQQWISVKDRLPEDGEEVLVFEDGTISTNCFSHYRVAPHRWDLYPSGFSCNPSYWMKLPAAPPKEDR